MRKLYPYLSITCAFLVFVTPAMTQEPQGVERSKDSTLRISPTYTHVWIKQAALEEFQGNLGGLEGAYQYRPVNFFYGGAKLAWRQGNTHSSSMDRYLVDIDAEEQLGYTVGFENGYLDRCTFYTGFGFRYLDNNLHLSSDELKMKYYEYYVPVGFLLDRSFNGWFTIGLNFAWMPQVDATVDTNPIGGARWVTDRKIANFSVEVPLKFELIKQFSMTIRPFYEFWQNGATTANTVDGIALGLEKNTYNFVGVALDLSYQF